MIKGIIVLLSPDLYPKSGSPIGVLKLFMKQLVISRTQHDAPSGMCMLAKTVAELTGEHAELMAEAKRSFRKMEGEFEALIIEDVFTHYPF
ncbi:hypothetical protein [Photobacterium lutimaris]|uniref:Uncharacterized protein n=1 Tax=Photobacterium lutimaris TaxID=388278 RepID=A0A2T3IYB7_9GAMM|nr:hypothetical protein [Photobacterium lutimaris]PSU33581.1 hypothetical protein C9I99_12470 [Photobacterium lutimaris]TDR74574.1 hypothetical protein DFP78_107161 [Photobacterium lutimaris]